MKFLYISVLSVTFLSCKEDIDLSYVKSNLWSYDSGFKIGEGDFVEFDRKQKIFELKGDTIFYNGNPRAIIESINKKYFLMKIKSIDGKEKGEYTNVEERLH